MSIRPPFFLTPSDLLVTDDNGHLSHEDRAINVVENGGCRLAYAYWEHADYYQVEGTAERILLVTLPVLEAFALGVRHGMNIRKSAA